MDFTNAIDNHDEDISLRNVTLLNTYVTFAYATMLIYDTMTSLDLEVKYVWWTQWSFIKALYLWTRYSAYVSPALGLVYLGFAPGLTPRMCLNAVSAMLWIDACGIAISEIVLALRTYALWSRNRRVAIAVGVVYISKVIVVIFAMSKFLQETQITSIPGHPGCFFIGNGVLLKVCWSMLLFGESIWVTFMLVESYRIYKEIRSFPMLFKIVLTDGILYFVLLLVLVIVVIAPAQSSSTLDLTVVLCTPARIMYSVFIAHLILHVKRVADPELITEASQVTLSVTTFRVARGTIARA
ncbi:hypothetical protein CONPUDRAFT_168059 [Coniophora puteana RWD-64-598 SS2]|uniref:DUF6533 domain-containing protein n=1 Tax=Coniophora puteana (strain RWD-64-598) TaxID=741705 RepID=A0A5M3MDC7_CONPW|nr:uncharacterized protein CONPUDRAFT_168059 [Coniophora puteana RWD-64-598 SS2]EIW77027.1 hypothetical protein CONPUDRAFT_168059 [Coniophora puteana RWD-64-598 SS2]